MRAKAWGLALRVEDWDTSAIELNVELVRGDQKFQSPSKPVEPLNVNKLSSFRRWIPSITGDHTKRYSNFGGLETTRPTGYNIIKWCARGYSGQYSHCLLFCFDNFDTNLLISFNAFQLTFMEVMPPFLYEQSVYLVLERSEHNLKFEPWDSDNE